MIISRKTNKTPLYERIGKAIINESISAGLTLLIIVLGVNYFSFKAQWTKVFFGMTEQIGAGQQISSFLQTDLAQEFAEVLASLGATFPFNIIFGQYSLTIGVAVGVILILTGVVFKILMKTSKEQFIKELGKEIYIPAIIGFFSMITIQILLAILGQTTGVSSLVNAKLFVWHTYGSLLTIGISAFVMGTILKIIAKKQKNSTLKLFGNTTMYGAYFCVAYYVILRILSIEVILNSTVGNFFKIFLISGNISAFVIIFCIFMFTFGQELNKYGKHLIRRKKHSLSI